MDIEATILSNGDLLLNQSKYIQELLHRAYVYHYKLLASPITTSFPLFAHIGDSLLNPSFYRSIVGTLRYITITRHDISYDVNKVCQFLSNPLVPHWDAVKIIFKTFDRDSLLWISV